MTEYVIIVGLVGILLVGAIGKFHDIIDVTIRGSGVQVQDAGDVNTWGVGSNGQQRTAKSGNRYQYDTKDHKWHFIGS